MPGLRDIFRREDARNASAEAKRSKRSKRVPDSGSQDWEQDKEAEAADRERVAGLERRSQGWLGKAGVHGSTSEIARRKGGDTESLDSRSDSDTYLPEGSVGVRVRWGKKRRGFKSLEHEENTAHDALSGSITRTYSQKERANEIEVVADPHGNLRINGKSVRAEDQDGVDRALGEAYERPRRVTRRVTEAEGFDY